MAYFDREYLKLVKTIFKEGELVKNRTGVDSIKIPDWYFKFDLEKEFPVLTIKQSFLRQAVLEMLWIYQQQSNEVKWLQDRDVHIWDEWEIDKNGLWTATQYLPNEDGVLEKREITKEYGKEFAGTIGKAYGYQVKKHQFTQKIINTLKTNPTDRGMVISLLQEEDLPYGVLRSCVWSVMFDVTKGRLNSIVNQRSCDVPLGLPFNVPQYAVFQHMLAQVTGYKPGTMVFNIKDTHIYVNQVEQMKEVVRRGDNLEDLEAPTLWINPNVDDFFKFDSSKECKDVKVLNYKHHGRLVIPISK